MEEVKNSFQNMQKGDIFLRTIDTGTFGLDGGTMFGIIPKPLWVKAYSEPDEMNRIPLAARPLLIRNKDKTILIDTGNGDKYSEKQIAIYNLDLEKSNILNALKSENLSRYDITDVILTHLHFDHCGASTIIVDGKIEPTFPKATYYVQEEHFRWANNPTEKDRGSFNKNDFLPLIENDNLKFTNGNSKFDDFLEFIPLYGHTPAMQSVKITVDEQIYFYAADLFPTSAHLNLPYILAYDNYPLTTLEEKKKILTQAIEENWIIIFEHDVFIKAGKVGKKNGSFYVSEKIDI
ncbi:MAG: MBL fold metallo-hydrolase [Ignavibacteria bacterium]|nr:MBL fold metallo-hydrolase [Ignavibacteria bacterium]